MAKKKEGPEAGARPVNETLIQPKHFRVNETKNHPVYGWREATSLTIYDYRLAEADTDQAVSDQTFQVLLNGKKMCSCSTKDGFLLRVELPPGIYRVTLQPERTWKPAIEAVVRTDRPGEYGLRVLVAPTSIQFDEFVHIPS